MTPSEGGGYDAVTVVSDDGTGVRNARVSLMATGPEQASTATTPGGRSSAPIAPVIPPVTAERTNLAAARDRADSALRLQARTDSGGMAAFGDLPGGAYTLSVIAPPGYVSDGTPSRVVVSAGARAAATMKLSRGGVITGRVLDEEGFPLMGAWVSLFRVTGGRVDAYGASTLPTDDLGAFRVWSLPAGQYLVAAHYDDRVGTVSGEGSPLGGYLVALLHGAKADAESLDTYLATYFPGVTALDAARSVQVRAGQETGGIDIPVARGRIGSITARIVDSYGGVSQSGTYQLVPRGRNAAVIRGSLGPEGIVRIPNVAAGDYYFWAVVQRTTDAVRTTEAGFLPVTMNGADVSVSLQTNTGASLSGRLVIEGIPPTPSGTEGASGQSAVKVTIRSALGGTSGFSWTRDAASSDGTVKPDGTFAITAVRGPVQIGTTGGLAALKAVRRGAIDISGQPLELEGTERLDNLTIVMTYDSGSLQGSVVDQEDEPLPGATVIVVPENPDTWNTGSPFVRTVTAAGPSAPGTRAPGAVPSGQVTAGEAGFVLTKLPAGRYLVIGVAGVPSGGVDRAMIEQWRGNGSTVIVEPGQTATVKVKANKMEPKPTAAP